MHNVGGATNARKQGGRVDGGVRLIPRLTDIGAERKVLLLGRYSCAFDEIRERYVPEGDENRAAIWDAFLKTVNLVKETVGSLAEVWIGGSFITDEGHPHDIDVVFFFKEGQIESVGKEGAFVLNVLARRLDLVQRLDSRADGYLVVVQPTKLDGDDLHGWTSQRGYWDQFWSKARFKDDDVRWLYPAAGYLEVVVDGYDD